MAKTVAILTVGMGIDRHLAAQAAGYRADVLHALEP
jgi:hypothetical protein